MSLQGDRRRDGGGAGVGQAQLGRGADGARPAHDPRHGAVGGAGRGRQAPQVPGLGQRGHEPGRARGDRRSRVHGEDAALGAVDAQRRRGVELPAAVDGRPSVTKEGNKDSLDRKSVV